MLSAILRPFVFTLLLIVALVLGLFPPTAPADRILAQPVRRAAIFLPLLAAFAVMDETTEHIVGTPRWMATALARSPLGQAYSFTTIQSLAVTTPGTTYPRDPEQLLLLGPDTVLVWAGTADHLRAVGLPVVEFSSLSFDRGALQAWQSLRDLIGKPRRADEVLRGFQIDERAYDASPAPSGSKTVVLLWQPQPMVFFMAGNLFPPAADIQRVGGNLLPKSGRTLQTNLEGLLKLDPDVILLSDLAGSESGPQEFFDNPVFASLSAVRTRSIYKMPAVGSHMEGIIPDRSIYLGWLAEILDSPKQPSNLRTLFKDTYARFYGVDLAADQIDAALFLNENRYSAGYERFGRSRNEP